MKIIKFRITNYKSILDSGYCFPTQGVTLLAGKNEAGKSSILEALACFNQESTIPESAIPLTKTKSKPKIEIWAELSDEDKSAIHEKLGSSHSDDPNLKEILKQIDQIHAEKSFPNELSVSGRFKELLDVRLQKKLSEIFRDFSIELTNRIPEDAHFSKALSNLLGILTKSGDSVKDRFASVQSAIDKAQSTITPETALTLKQTVSLYASLAETTHSEELTLASNLKKAIQDQIPKFVLFSSFEDVFPNEISFELLDSNPWIQDLRSISDLDISLIRGSNSAGKKQHKHKLNLQINENFKQYWSQDFSNLSIDWDDGTLNFWIEEDGIFYPPALRSQGRRWHLAFYVKVSARISSSGKSVLLIDEPGLYLHAIAQRDILKHLEDSSKTSQILVSTHSPYLIEPNKLERVRLVLKSDSRGTQIENKLHASSDAETLTPILTAIGLELNQGIANVALQSNVIVEGPSDYFYLTALSEILNSSDINFVSGGGAGNMTKVGTILQGWGTKVLYLFDNDKAFQNAKSNIRREWITISKDWLVSLDLTGSIEDIFEKDDFAQIIGVASGAITESNSSYMKANKLDKVLPAKLYLDSVRSGTHKGISEATREKAVRLLNDLRLKFDNYYTVKAE